MKDNASRSWSDEQDAAIRRGWATEEPITVTAAKLAVSATAIGWRRLELGLADGHEFHGAILGPLARELTAI